ncbi:hypothetical protein HY642_05110 [Candidatus Woesearchaeota archaeon]|nr:hypothetical protein [Candidatus Woesearchaeota archaeon]
MAVCRVLVEGPDCSGKSTLVERLKNALRWDSKSLRHIEGDQFERYIKEYASQRFVVFDRGHVSEAVYGRLWRGGSPFAADERRLLDDFTSSRIYVILACPALSAMQERYSARRFAQQISVDELEQCRNLFIEECKPNITYHSESWDELDAVVAQTCEVAR